MVSVKKEQPLVSTVQNEISYYQDAQQVSGTAAGAAAWAVVVLL